MCLRFVREVVLWLLCEFNTRHLKYFMSAEGTGVAGKQALVLEALLHAVSSLCSGDGAKELCAIIPATAETSTETHSSRNAEMSSVLYSFMSELLLLNHDLTKPILSPLFAYASPLLRLVVVLVVDLYSPLLSHFANSETHQSSAFEELCGLTKSCCELLVQSVYVPEEFNVASASHVVLSGPQTSFVGAILPFRVKQDHIGCVSLGKMTQMIKKLSAHPSTRNAIFHLSHVIMTGPSTSSVLPNMVCHDVEDSSLSESWPASAYATHVCTDVLAQAYNVHGQRAESTSDTSLLVVKTFIHLMISFTEVKQHGMVLSSPRYVCG